MALCLCIYDKYSDVDNIIHDIQYVKCCNSENQALFRKLHNNKSTSLFISSAIGFPHLLFDIVKKVTKHPIKNNKYHSVSLLGDIWSTLLPFTILILRMVILLR